MDVESKVLLEDGEISDEDTIVYIPLERPVNIITTNTALRSQEKHSDNESDWSSKSDTDSDDPSAHAKKSKVKIKTKTIARSTGRRKKYDIWSKHIQEDVLAETLVSCDVSNIDRSRDVESYTFPRYEDKFDLRHKLKRGHKRRHDHRNNKNMSLERNEESDDDVRGSARKMACLVTSVDNTDEEVAKDIANKLCEEKDDLLLRIVKIAGKMKAIEVFNETRRIEMDGGMLIMNRTRRRTPGGVFIFLLKRDDDITQDQQTEIFSEEKREQTREKKIKQRAKLKAIKSKIKAKKMAKENLPALLTRGELIVQNLNGNTSERNESESEEFVNNPPPSPVTDGKENSNDGITDMVPAVPPIADLPNRNLNHYDDDFLDIASTADMDIF